MVNYMGVRQLIDFWKRVQQSKARGCSNKIHTTNLQMVSTSAKYTQKTLGIMTTRQITIQCIWEEVEIYPVVPLLSFLGMFVIVVLGS